MWSSWRSERRRAAPWLAILLATAPVSADNPRPAMVRILNAGWSEPWRRLGPIEFYRGSEIYEYMDGAGEIPLACGYQDLATARFVDDDGRIVTAELYRMASPADAFGLWSFHAPSEGSEVAFAHPARVGGGTLCAWKGAYAIRLLADQPEGVPDQRLVLLGGRLEAAVGELGAPPELLSALPEAGRIPGSQRYFHGKFALDTIWFRADDLLGLAAGADVVAARYADPPGLVIVARYPTARAAAEAHARWARAFALDADGVGRDGDDWVGARRAGTVVRMVVEGSSREAVAAWLAPP